MTKRRFLLCLLMMLLVAAISVLAVSCGKKTPDEPGKTEWPEAGVYYYDAGHDEYTLTLNVGDTFALIVKGVSASGSYTLEGGALTLDFSAEGKENVSATFADGVVTMTYEGASMRFLKKVNHTVSFETNGGSSVASATVVNGKTVAKPQDPTRDGFVFVGWYADSAFKTPFAFDAQPVTSDTTVYAQWSAELAGGVEYTVNFDLNYENAVNPDSVKTQGGKLFDLPDADRDGYTFQGWWISMDKDGSKLSYQYTDGMTLDANTTLYALWQANTTGTKLPAPVLNVSAGSVSWSNIGARSYDVKVIGPDGKVLIDESTGNTTFNVPFATYPAGEYEIRVTANAQSGASDNSEAVRYYTNKALRTVSVFNVVGSTLVFNTVENAEKYLVSVVCGNPDHNHTNFDNGTSRTFSFANCDMTADGIKFTVTAVAEGYASSTSEVFVYKRALPAVEGLVLDAATQTVSWNEVPDAAYYMVSVLCGNSAHDHGFVNNGTKTSVSLKECAALDGGIVVKVYPVAKGYSSPEASELTYDKSVLATPSELVINGNVLSWATVEGATEYEVQVGNQIHKVTENSLDLSAYLNGVAGSEYALSVRAVGESQSLWSDTLTAKYYEMGTSVSYAQGVLSWSAVIGVDGYQVQVNDGAILTVNGETSAAVTLTKAGVNKLKVRFVDGNVTSAWVSTEVFAHVVTFDSRGGSEVSVQYKAVGDKLELPVPTKNGYTFADWYNVPGGPASNGLVYTDEFFSESGAMVLYAHYDANKYDVVYNYGNGGTGDRESDEVSYEQSYQLYVPTPNNGTDTFGGWFSAPYGMGTQYTDEKGNSLAPWGATEGAELYAFWIDSALSFTLTQVNGKDAYLVSAGERLSLVSEVTIPATFRGLPVLMVAGNAFKDATNLTVINLPSTLEQISLIDPFSGCTNLVAVNVYDVEGATGARYWSEDGVLFDNGSSTGTQTKLLYMPLGKTGAYTVPDGVVEIPESAFSGSKLSTVVIPASVSVIGNDAFASCLNLTSVVFEAAESGASSSLTIGKRAFKGCLNLEKVALPAHLTSIALSKYTISGSTVTVKDVDNAFYGCNLLNSITVASGSTTYKTVDGVLYSADGKTLVYCPTTKANEFTVPTGVQTIAPGAFIGCMGLTEITVPNSVTYVGECAFYGLDITKVTFLGNGFNDVTVGKYAFRDCDELEQLAVTESRLAAINEGAFWGCKSLTELSLPASVTSIGAEAFRDCTALTSVTLADSEKELVFGEDAFYNCSSIVTIHLPANVSKLPGVFSGCSKLESVTVAENSPYFTSEDGVLFDKDKTEIVFFPQGKTGEYVLPTTVTVINNGVFMNVKLDKLTIPNGISVIGDEAFRGATIDEIVFEGETAAESLTIGSKAFYNSVIGTLTLPAHTTELGANVFEECQYGTIVLNEGIAVLPDYAFYAARGDDPIAIPASVTHIGKYCFGGYDAGSYWWPDLRLPDFTFPATGSKLEVIGEYAFSANSYLTELVVPASVKVIDNYAFFNCEDLESVTFEPGSALTTIGAYAFAHRYTSYSGYSLTTIELPATLTSVGAYAFANTSLVTVTFLDGGESAGDLVLGAPFAYTYPDYNGTLLYKMEMGHVFDGCEDLESVSLPSNLVEIGAYSFYNAGSSADSLSVTLGENSRLATIGEGAFYYANLTSFHVPASVRNLDPYVDNELGLTYDRLGIGKQAFYFLYDSLATITFELGGTEPLTIGEGAFDNAALLTTVTLPNRLAPYTSYTGQIIPGLANGGDVFNSADALTAVYIEDGGKYYDDVDGVVYTADFTELIFCPYGRTGEVNVPATVTKVHDKAFYECKGVTAVNFAGGSEDMTIGNQAFYKCTGLTAMVLPDNVVTLGDEVFYRCESLESLTLSANLTNFESVMIEGCSKLTTINVSDGSAALYNDNGVIYSGDKSTLLLYPANREDESYTVLEGTTKIAANAFAGNTHLKTVVLPAGLREIGAYAFSQCTALNDLVIPNTVELIDDRAFIHTDGMTNLTFEKGGEELLIIGTNAFYESGITAIEIPARVAVINDYAFYHADIETVTFEEGSKLTTVGNSVFLGADALVSVDFPAGLVTIGDENFYECESLVSVTFAEGLVSMGSKNFFRSSLQSISLPASLTTMGVQNFAYCESLNNVSFAPGCALSVLPEGSFYECGSLESIVIPAAVTELADKDYYGVFQNCDRLSSVIFEEGSKLTKIGSYAFYQCALTEFDVPPAVGTLGDYAFYYCASLARVSIPMNTTVLGINLFSGCTALSEVDLKAGVTVLPDNMFYGCSALTSLTIPATVTGFGSGCFTGTGIEAFAVEENSTNLVAIDGILYSADKTQIVCYPPAKKADVLTIPKEVTLIGDSTFENVTSLKKVVFEEGGTEPLVIGAYAFSNCYTLHTVELPARLQSIGKYAFRNCVSLMSITLPESLQIIEDYAFYGCDKLIEVYNKSSLNMDEHSSYGDVAYSYRVENIYTPTEGASILTVDENGYVFYTDSYADLMLLGYVGFDTDLVLPDGEYGIEAYAFARNDALTTVLIPASANVTHINSSAFYYLDNVTFLVAVESKPSAWSGSWNGSRPVVWGYDGNEHAYSFVSNGGTEYDAVVSTMPVAIPTPTRDGYHFDGWYLNADFSGSKISGNYYSKEGATFYAKWMTEEEYQWSLIVGTEMQYAYDVQSGSSYDVKIVTRGTQTYFKVTVEAGDVWNITTSGSGDHQIWFYDADGNQIQKYDSGSAENYDHTFTEAGTYYIGLGFYSSYYTGNYTVTFTDKSAE